MVYSARRAPSADVCGLTGCGSFSVGKRRRHDLVSSNAGVTGFASIIGWILNAAVPVLRGGALARALERILFRRDSSVHGMARVSAVPATYFPDLVIHKEIREK